MYISHYAYTHIDTHDVTHICTACVMVQGKEGAARVVELQAYSMTV